MASLSHPVDYAIALLSRADRLFRGGWGDRSVLTELEQRGFPLEPPGPIEIRWSAPRTARGGLVLKDGVFESPLESLPDKTRFAHVRLVSSSARRNRSACVVLAGSREEGYGLRQMVHGKLVAAGIDLLLLENPYYGKRRPLGQSSSSVATVSDHLQMNVATIAEARALLAWSKAEGYDHTGVTGYSMGGYMAAATAALTPDPIAVAVLAAGASPAPVFAAGLLSWSIDFGALGREARARIETLFELASVLRLAPPPAGGAVILGCKRDGYVPKSETLALAKHWPHAELRWISAGHVSAMLTERAALRGAVRDAFARIDS